METFNFSETPTIIIEPVSSEIIELEPIVIGSSILEVIPTEIIEVDPITLIMVGIISIPNQR